MKEASAADPLCSGSDEALWADSRWYRRLARLLTRRPSRPRKHLTFQLWHFSKDETETSFTLTWMEPKPESSFHQNSSGQGPNEGEAVRSLRPLVLKVRLHLSLVTIHQNSPFSNKQLQFLFLLDFLWSAPGQNYTHRLKNIHLHPSLLWRGAEGSRSLTWVCPLPVSDHDGLQFHFAGIKGFDRTHWSDQCSVPLRWKKPPKNQQGSSLSRTGTCRNTRALVHQRGQFYITVD